MTASLLIQLGYGIGLTGILSKNLYIILFGFSVVFLEVFKLVFF